MASGDVQVARVGASTSIGSLSVASRRSLSCWASQQLSTTLHADRSCCRFALPPGIFFLGINRSTRGAYQSRNLRPSFTHSPSDDALSAISRHSQVALLLAARPPDRTLSAVAASRASWARVTARHAIAVRISDCDIGTLDRALVMSRVYSRPNRVRWQTAHDRCEVDGRVT